MSAFARMMHGQRSAPPAPANPYFTTVSGKQVDLVRPRVEDVDFRDVAHHLSHGCRYGGACRRTYPVGEHLVRGMLYTEPSWAAYWLAHDLHEYVAQDDATPKKRARPLVMLDELREQFPLADLEKFRLAIETADDAFEQRHMRAVHLAAGLKWPVPIEIERKVKALDRRMLVSEWAALMPGNPPPGYEDAAPIEKLFPNSAAAGMAPHFEQLRQHFYAMQVNWLPALLQAQARSQLAAHAGLASRFVSRDEIQDGGGE
jgi:hypothetical protein